MCHWRTTFFTCVTVSRRNLKLLTVRKASPTRRCRIRLGGWSLRTQRCRTGAADRPLPCPISGRGPRIRRSRRRMEAGLFCRSWPWAGSSGCLTRSIRLRPAIPPVLMATVRPPTAACFSRPVRPISGQWLSMAPRTPLKTSDSFNCMKPCSSAPKT